MYVQSSLHGLWIHENERERKKEGRKEIKHYQEEHNMLI